MRLRLVLPALFLAVLMVSPPPSANSPVFNCIGLDDGAQAQADTDCLAYDTTNDVIYYDFDCDCNVDSGVDFPLTLARFATDCSISFTCNAANKGQICFDDAGNRDNALGVCDGTAWVYQLGEDSLQIITNKTIAASSNSIDLEAGVTVTDIEDGELIIGTGSGTTEYGNLSTVSTGCSDTEIHWTGATGLLECDSSFTYEDTGNLLKIVGDGSYDTVLIADIGDDNSLYAACSTATEDCHIYHDEKNDPSDVTCFDDPATAQTKDVGTVSKRLLISSSGSVEIEACHSPTSCVCDADDHIQLDGTVRHGSASDPHDFFTWGKFYSSGQEFSNTTTTGNNPSFLFNSDNAGHTGEFFRWQDESNNVMDMTVDDGDTDVDLTINATITWESYADNDSTAWIFDTVNDLDATTKMYSWREQGTELAYLLSTGDWWFLGEEQLMEGSTADDNELTITLADPTADRTITWPDESGTVCVGVTGAGCPSPADAACSGTTTYLDGEANCDDITAATYDNTFLGDWTFNPNGTGANGDFDVTLGDGTYAGISMGNAQIYASSFSSGANLDLDKAVLFRQGGNLGVGNDPGIEFAWMEQGNTIRLAIPESGSGNATALIRSTTVAGPDPSPKTNDIVTCDYWTSYDSNIDCDTGATGADFFVQDDFEVEGTIFAHETINLEGATADGNQVILQVGADPGADVTITLPTATGTLITDACVDADADGTCELDVNDTGYSLDYDLDDDGNVEFRHTLSEMEWSEDCWGDNPSTGLLQRGTLGHPDVDDHWGVCTATTSTTLLDDAMFGPTRTSNTVTSLVPLDAASFQYFRAVVSNDGTDHRTFVGCLSTNSNRVMLETDHGFYAMCAPQDDVDGDSTPGSADDLVWWLVQQNGDTDHSGDLCATKTGSQCATYQAVNTVAYNSGESCDGGTTEWTDIVLRRDGVSDILWFIDGVYVTTMSTNITSEELWCGLIIESTNTTASTANIDYMGWKHAQ